MMVVAAIAPDARVQTNEFIGWCLLNAEFRYDVADDFPRDDFARQANRRVAG
jgi:hypothetical protein